MYLGEVILVFELVLLFYIWKGNELIFLSKEDSFLFISFFMGMN